MRRAESLTGGGLVCRAGTMDHAIRHRVDRRANRKRADRCRRGSPNDRRRYAGRRMYSFRQAQNILPRGQTKGPALLIWDLLS